MVAALRSQLDLKLRVCAIHCLHNPVAAVTYRDIVFCLACHDAVAASHAFLRINSHRVSHDATSSLPRSVMMVTKLPLMPVPPMTGSIITFVISFVSFAPRP